MFRPLLLLALLSACTALPRILGGGGRIVNGTNAPAGKYPSQVSLQYFGSHMCGASILNKNYVITAAHCVADEVASSLNVLAGTVNLNSGGHSHKVVEIKAHEGYNPNNMYINDIALLRVNPAFELGDGDEAPVTLPAQGQDSAAGSTATVIGWGYPYTGGNVMDRLQEVDIMVVGDDDCERIHNGDPHPSNICAGVPEGGKGQCSGDSGGPLFVNGYQAGIVSWSVKPCTIAPYPGVFTEVSHFIDWINANAN